VCANGLSGFNIRYDGEGAGDVRRAVQRDEGTHMKIANLFLALSLVSTWGMAQTAAPAEKPKTEQQNRMTTCNKEAGDKTLKGDERKAFMKSCLSGEKAEAHTSQQNKMKTCNKTAGEKALKGDARKQFMSTCLKG
jgi:hypothetical protein